MTIRNLAGFAVKSMPIVGMLESVGANTSGTAITLRTAAGTATIGAIDRAGAHAIEEQLCFAAKWSGMSREEAGENISYEVDTSYMASAVDRDVTRCRFFHSFTLHS